MADDEKTFGLCDHASVLALQALYDKEHGLPIKCYLHDGSEPPPGVPRTILHAVDPEPVERDAEGKPTSWAHPLPRTKLSPELAARIVPKTRAELDALRPELPDPAADRVP